MALIKTPTPNADPAQLHLPERPERDCAQLLAQLHDERPEARRWAARDLVDCPGSSAAVVAGLLAESDHSVREIMLTTLVRMGDADAVEGLVRCLRSEDAALRNEAIEALKQLPQAVAPIMQRLLGDADSDLRIFAVNVLESLRHPDVETWLTEVIAHDAHVNVCATAANWM